MEVKKGILRAQVARQTGCNLETIRYYEKVSLLSLTDAGTQTCGEVMASTEQHLADVRRKITDLQRIEATLAETLAQCTGGEVADCPILDVLHCAGTPQ